MVLRKTYIVKWGQNLKGYKEKRGLIHENWKARARVKFERPIKQQGTKIIWPQKCCFFHISKVSFMSLLDDPCNDVAASLRSFERVENFGECGAVSGFADGWISIGLKCRMGFALCTASRRRRWSSSSSSWRRFSSSCNRERHRKFIKMFIFSTRLKIWNLWPLKLIIFVHWF